MGSMSSSPIPGTGCLRTRMYTFVIRHSDAKGNEMRSQRRVQSEKVRRARPWLETLEDRTVPVASPLDPTFGSGGLAAVNIPGHPNTFVNTMAVQPDGKVVVAGGNGNAFAVARFNPNGTLDSSFGSGGFVAHSFSVFSTQVHAIAVQPDGKIVLAGSDPFDWYVGRINANGSLDDNTGLDSTPGDWFGTVVSTGSTAHKGFIIGGFGGIGSNPNAVLIQPDGKIVGAGRSMASGERFWLIRWNVDGSRDDGTVNDATPGDQFGTSTPGSATSTVNASNAEGIRAMVRQSDGKLVVAGYSGNDFAVGRYNADGSVDTTFGVGGWTITNVLAGAVDVAHALLVQGDGKVVVAGRA